MKLIQKYTLILLAFLVLMLPGCTQNTPSVHSSVRKIDLNISEPITLRIMLEPYDPEFEAYVQTLIDDFTAIYEDITIETEWLPTGQDEKYYLIWEEERPKHLTAVYDEIEGEGGPDLYLLHGTNHFKDKLFPDVNIAMRQGYFADLNEFYMTDDALGREDLSDAVMDAGVVNGARYLLPISYDYSVACVDMERLYESGLDSSIFDRGVNGLLDSVCKLGDSDVANALYGVTGMDGIAQYFPNMLDYDTNEVMLTSEELTDFLMLVQDYHSLRSGEITDTNSLTWYYEGLHWWQQGHCMNIGSLIASPGEAALSKVMQYNLEMFPITGTEGVITADIECFGAVNSNCKHPEAAYELLRLFLQPDTISAEAAPVGYPVRTHEYSSALFRHDYQSSLKKESILIDANLDDAERQKRQASLESMDITDSDLPILQNTIGAAQITPLELRKELSAVINQLNDPATGEPTDVDIAQLAQGYIDFLNNYLHGQLNIK